ncbi:MAG: hypothetical protein WCI59_13285 [Betaproteobacteria bacterium]
MAAQSKVHCLPGREFTLVGGGSVDRRQDRDLDTEARRRDGKMAPGKEPIRIGQMQRGRRIPSNDGGRGALLKQMCSVQRRTLGAQ